MRFESEEHRAGVVPDCQPTKDDISKKKFWNYTVMFKNGDGTTFQEEFVHPASEQIVVFWHLNMPLPKDFPLAPFKRLLSRNAF